MFGLEREARCRLIIVLLALTLSKGCRNADVAGLRCKVGGGYRRTIAMRRAASRNESLRPSPLSVRRGAGLECWIGNKADALPMPRVEGEASDGKDQRE